MRLGRSLSSSAFGLELECFALTLDIPEAATQKSREVKKPLLVA